MLCEKGIVWPYLFGNSDLSKMRSVYSLLDSSMLNKANVHYKSKGKIQAGGRWWHEIKSSGLTVASPGREAER